MLPSSLGSYSIYIHKWAFFTDLTPTFQNEFNFKSSRGGKTISRPTSGTEFDHCVFNLRLHLTELFTPCLYITFNLTHPEQILSGNEVTRMKISWHFQYITWALSTYTVKLWENNDTFPTNKSLWKLIPVLPEPSAKSFADQSIGLFWSLRMSGEVTAHLWYLEA